MTACAAERGRAPMQNIIKAMTAGLIATVVLSALMLLKSMMGIMPELDIPQMISSMMTAPGTHMTGWPMNGHMGGYMGSEMGEQMYGWPGIGWAVHFMIGIVVYGGAMAFLDERLPGNSRIGHGLMIGTLGWLVMMVVMMPMAGAGLFGMRFGAMAPMMTLLLHLIFGGVLGWVYAKLIERPGAKTGNSV